MEALVQHEKHKVKAYDDRKQEIEKLEKDLQKEIDHNEDILLLSNKDKNDLYEVYRNIPKKMSSFHGWCQNNVESKYVMKVDDDSYVDIHKVLQVQNYSV